jgi:phosphatidylserine/phosphatidylglycerophosphate/cardiolipin synthase-like enzyme
MLNLFRALLTAALFAALVAPPGAADPAPIIHYAPAENLEHVGVALIDRAQHEIDMAAYVLTDWPVMQALTRAADRGVHIRIYLDGTQLAERRPAKVFNDLAETPGVEIRTKPKRTAPMRLKSYQIDGKLLRTVRHAWPRSHARETRIAAGRWHYPREVTGNAAQYQVSVFNFAPSWDQFI